MPFRWLVIAFIASVCCIAARAQAVLTVSSWLPPGHVLSATQRVWCDLLEQRSGGRLRCRMLPKPVAAAPGTFDALSNGRADISFTVPGTTPGRFELTQIAELPFLGEQAEAISVALQRIVSRTPALAEEYKDVKLLAVFTHGPGLLLNTRRPVTRLEDLNGMRFRVGGGMASDIAKALGLSAAIKPPQDSLALLTSGALDGTLCAAEAVQAFGIAPVLRHGTMLPGGLYNTAFAFVMNPARYAALSPELKKVVDEVSGEHAARLFGRAWDSADREGQALMKASGLQWTKADATLLGQIVERVAPLEQRWAAAARAKGLKEPERLLAEFRAEIQRLER